MITETTTPIPGTPDAKGTPYDPGRHIARQNPRTGRWMPRSPGRHNAGQARLPGVDAAAHPVPASAPAPDAVGVAKPEEVNVSEIIGLTFPKQTVPHVSEPTKEGEQTPPPTNDGRPPSFVPKEEPKEEAPAGGGSAPGVDVTVTPEMEVQAEAAVDAIEFLTGCVTGEHEEAAMDKKRRAAMVRVVARWFALRGWVVVCGAMVAIFVVSYWMETGKKQKTRGVILNWIRRKKTKPAEVVTVAPAPSPVEAAPATPAAPVKDAEVIYFP